MIITEASLAKMDPGEKAEQFYRDSKLTGYAVRVRRLADGTIRRDFMVMYQERRDGKRKWVKAFIGQWGAGKANETLWKEAAARREAARLLSMRENGAPVVSAKTAAKAAQTVGTLIETFRAGYYPRLKQKSQKDYDLCIAKIPDDFKSKRLASLSRTEIQTWHIANAGTPYMANKNLQVLSSMMGYAIELGWLDANPCLAIRQFQEKPRETWLNETEMPAFIAELAKHTTAHAELLRFLTVSGWRVSEGLKLRFDQVDPKNMVAHLEDTKTGKQTRALSSDAAILIDRQAHKTGFVFSTREGRSSLGYKQVRELLRDICKDAGVTVISPHGLRHSAATHAARAGASLFELKEGFGWKSHQMASRYVSRAESLAQAGVQKAASAINIFERPVAKVVRAR